MEITVRQGDTLHYYSQLFDIPLPLIEDANQRSQVFAEETVYIPGYQSIPYIIQSDDSFQTIATNRNIPVDRIALLNQTSIDNSLTVGHSICLPKKVTELIVTDLNDYTYEKMQQDLHKIAKLYPFITLQSIGSSVMGKDLIEVQIGNGSKQVHLNGSFHGTEWITTSVILKFINEYAISLTNQLPMQAIATLPLYQAARLSIVPMVNPDGVNLVIKGSASAAKYEANVLDINHNQDDFSNWKANIRGVDLNKQFPACWNVEANRKPTSPQPRDFPGYMALTEPEAIAMANLAKQRHFMRLLALHTQGEEIYWGFEGFEPAISQKIVNEYAQVSGYQPVRYLDSFAGYKDWFIQEFQRPGFTLELGLGVNPLPFEQYPIIYQKTRGILLASLYL
ncbi:M14 family metallopeptidase [Virgibacillus salexigens]|uniref:Gamma-D-glutamyl-L-diamino acid endopeptidase 1 n=2 Tax=Virgibacillus TaxID=84406 RepID=A0A024QBE7_9BACI|nr:MULTISPECIES: M14 family metallocarboxypeptidase [Virgibacillus]MYL42039.1 LysM peptidoglycan-binding domain-containing protein [Virgibacillus massiliensis]GGJ46125.1 hypothetical protein GCM10007111_05090 [Virgibacillus kapii]CDQ39868.1 Gamma-D-glutamyl-L-diamino acid endopeptidase 1 [Virgibacillus massiliensis]